MLKRKIYMYIYIYILYGVYTYIYIYIHTHILQGSLAGLSMIKYNNSIIVFDDLCTYLN